MVYSIVRRGLIDHITTTPRPHMTVLPSHRESPWVFPWYRTDHQKSHIHSQNPVMFAKRQPQVVPLPLVPLFCAPSLCSARRFPHSIRHVWSSQLNPCRSAEKHGERFLLLGCICEVAPLWHSEFPNVHTN